jgi:hypothetical protein
MNHSLSRALADMERGVPSQRTVAFTDMGFQTLSQRTADAAAVAAAAARDNAPLEATVTKLTDVVLSLQVEVSRQHDELERQSERHDHRAPSSSTVFTGSAAQLADQREVLPGRAEGAAARAADAAREAAAAHGLASQNARQCEAMATLVLRQDQRIEDLRRQLDRRLAVTGALLGVDEDGRRHGQTDAATIATAAQRKALQLLRAPTRPSRSRFPRPDGHHIPLARHR